MSLLGWRLKRRLRRSMALVARRPGEIAADSKPTGTTYAVAWSEGRVAGQPVALVGRFGLRFRGDITVGWFDWGERVVFRRPDRWRSGPLTRVIGSGRNVGSILEPTVAAAARLSPAVKQLNVSTTGSRCARYGPATSDAIVSDVTVLAELATKIAELPDPPLLAAVKARDLHAVCERLAAGDDANFAGPRDRICPGNVGTRPETPLLAALLEGDVELARILIGHSGIDPAEASLAPVIAVDLQHRELLDTILVVGSTGLRHWDFTFALGRAVNLSWVEGAERLLEAGADPDLVDLPHGAGSEGMRRLLERARAARRAVSSGPVAEARQRDGGLRGAPLRWRDRLRVVLPWTRDRPGAGWPDAARELGLELVHDGRAARLEGTVNGIEIRVEVVGTGPATRTFIIAGGAPQWLSLRRESLREKLGLTAERFMVPTAATQWMKTNDVLTRDDPFDQRIEVHGPVADCLAVLSHRVRALVLDFVDGLGGTVGDGHICLELAGRIADQSRLVRLVRATHELARAIAAQLERGPLACLVENATNDPNEYLRATMLAALGERFPGAKETLVASRFALKTARYDWLRMTAASNLGEEGSAAYREILGDTTQRPEVRGMALRHLGWRGGPAAEDLVLGYLDAIEQPIVLHAIRILKERAGTARSMKRLRRLAGPLPASEIARAAAEAVEGIQSRLVNAGPGQLSLTKTGQDGELSLTQSDDSGKISLSPEEPRTDDPE